MKKLILILLMLSMLASCRASKKSSASTETKEKIDVTYSSESMTRNLHRPGVNLLLGQRLSISHDGHIEPISRSIRDDVSGKTLAFKIDGDGEIFISSTSPPDTLTEVFKKENFKFSEEKDEKKTEKSQTKKSSYGFLFGVLSAFGLVILFILYFRR